MLRCVSRYRSGMGRFEVGEIIDDEALIPALLNDSPDSFEVVTSRALKAAPAHRMVTEGDTRSSTDVVVGAAMTTENFVAVKEPQHRTRRRG